MSQSCGLTAEPPPWGGAEIVVLMPPVEAYPAKLEPHLVVLVRAAAGTDGNATLETVFRRGDEEVGRNRQTFFVEPGKFGYRLVKGEATGKPGEEIDAGRMGKIRIGDNSEAAMSQPFSFDKSNIDQFAKIF